MHWSDPKVDQVLGLGGFENNQNGLKAKVYVRSHFGLDSRHYRECESFRIDSRTIKRGIT